VRGGPAITTQSRNEARDGNGARLAISSLFFPLTLQIPDDRRKLIELDTQILIDGAAVVVALLLDPAAVLLLLGAARC
jgi:hypothetical protein